VVADEVIIALRRVADACQDAADEAADLADRYAALREQARRLNDRHGWATRDEFDAQVPTVDALVEIESLDRALEQGLGRDSVDPRRAATHLTDALLQLAGWATGVRLAHETLRDIDS
jgi:hypothetical protein